MDIETYKVVTLAILTSFAILDKGVLLWQKFVPKSKTKKEKDDTKYLISCIKKYDDDQKMLLAFFVKENEPDGFKMQFYHIQERGWKVSEGERIKIGMLLYEKMKYLMVDKIIDFDKEASNKHRAKYDKRGLKDDYFDGIECDKMMLTNRYRELLIRLFNSGKLDKVLKPTGRDLFSIKNGYSLSDKKFLSLYQ